MNEVSKEYFPSIKRNMKSSTSVGLIGGKPGYAYYFVGQMEDPAENFKHEKCLTDSLVDSFVQIECSSKPEPTSPEYKISESDRLIFLDPHCVLP